MARFNVTYELWDETAEIAGDPDDIGYVSKDVSLRDAIADVIRTFSCTCPGVECVEASDSLLPRARWFTVTNGRDWRDGTQEVRVIRIPDHVTGASRVRIARILGIKG